MLPTLDPQKLAQVQAVSKFIEAKITVNYSEGSVTLNMESDQAQGSELIPSLLEQFSGALATQLSSVFAIKGEIIEVGKEKD